MPNAKVLAGSGRLKQSLRALKDCWLRTESGWTDAVRLRFEERHLAPLEPAVEAAIIGMQSLAQVMDEVRRDCSDRSESP